MKDNKDNGDEKPIDPDDPSTWETMPGRNGGTLRRWPKGVSGNPAGKPKGTLSITTRVKMLLGDAPSNPNGKTYERLLAETIIQKALEGDPQFAKMVWDRIDGPVTQKLIQANVDAEDLDDETREKIADFAERMDKARSS